MNTICIFMNKEWFNIHPQFDGKISLLAPLWFWIYCQQQEFAKTHALLT